MHADISLTFILSSMFVQGITNIRLQQDHLQQILYELTHKSFFVKSLFTRFAHHLVFVQCVSLRPSQFTLKLNALYFFLYLQHTLKQILFKMHSIFMKYSNITHKSLNLNLNIGSANTSCLHKWQTVEMFYGDSTGC